MSPPSTTHTESMSHSVVPFTIVLPRNTEWTVRAIFANTDPSIRAVIQSAIKDRGVDLDTIRTVVFKRAHGSKRSVQPIAPNTASLGSSDLNYVLAKVMRHHIAKDVYARLKATSYGGVGVFAIRPIPKGVFPFRTLAGLCYAEESINLDKTDIARIHPNMKAYMDDFFIGDEGKFPIPMLGPNGMDISFYLNHSDTPNMEIVYHPTCKYTTYRTSREIRDGEELSIDYCKFARAADALRAQLDPHGIYLRCPNEKAGKAQSRKRKPSKPSSQNLT